MAVKAAFESTYSALGLSCADVGGLWDTEGYFEGMEPCVDSAEPDPVEEIAEEVVDIVEIAGLCYASCATDNEGRDVCRFTARVNLFAGELGYYGFEECGDVSNPTLAMEVGRTYEFVQQDPSN